MNIDMTSPSSRSKRAQFGIPCAAGIAVALLLLAPMSSASSQDNNELQELKETIKQEILEELRSDASIDASRGSALLKLKEDIIQEILEELREEQKAAEASANRVQQKLKEDLREEILADLEAAGFRQNSSSAGYAIGPFGQAEGAILRNGSGLPSCRVKLVALSGRSSRFSGYGEGEEFTTVTDKNGEYRFERLPPGPYKLKWELPGNPGWIRRLSDRPDGFVREGELSVLKPVETERGLVSGS